MPQKGSPSPSPLWRPAGTVGCLCLRALQLVLAVAALAVMASSTGELTSDQRPWYLALVALCQCLWSLPMALLDAQALLASRSWQYRPRTSLFVTVADGITTAAVFVAASSSLGLASAASAFDHAEWPHGAGYQTVVAMAFLSFASLNTSFFINISNLAYHSQRQQY